MIKDIENIFKGRKGKILGSYKKAAVLIPIYIENGETYILFEKRALNLRTQPGDICFPGGKIEDNETRSECAIRETVEELNIGEEYVEIIGEMDYLITHGNLIMYVLVGRVTKFPTDVNKDEVHSVLKVPINFFKEHKPIEYEMEVGPNLKEDFPYDLIRGGKNYKFSKSYVPQYFYKYKEEIIWGNTARIITEFMKLLS
ncbi:8-oxo-dGTP pyrophosphatase MutT, NUDIX family [Clostridium cavendishii DSM 21758]|uniref:8-oxo-dGTP pyrophosphatase MutT, NUDIX family n=1 Tax=Clostridium cavendishii DSM 21758 TaxID=1121302 RepID=A0A1M6VBP7_9CLOT|nr:CoA pyrophosphatase [Clostridium cavendishii]SHK78900.1 8-oxo-dGTP pyrophosphatase MutT, NUDIX family [Clostridium cavendishii DSM 21758]